MPIDYASRPPNQMRREDKAQDEGWIKAMLRRVPFGALATAYEGQPFVHTNLFAYDEAAHAIYFHTAREGRTRANVEANGRACFSISEMGRLLPDEEALEFSVEYKGVAVFGRVTVLEEKAEQRHALQMLLDRYFPHLKPGQDYRPITDEELARTTVYKLAIESWSGKKSEGRPDHPGAFFYGSPPD